MKKTFKFTNLDCAHCALKIEDGIKALPGIEKATVSLITEKISITAADSETIEALIPQVKKIIKTVEPDMEVEF